MTNTDTRGLVFAAITGMLWLVLSVPVHGAEPEGDGQPGGNDRVSLVFSGESFYSRNNFDRERDESSDQRRDGYWLATMSANLSLKHLFDSRAFISPYLNMKLVHDFGDESWNRSYWNNNQVMGLGVKLGTESSFTDEEDRYIGGWEGALFSEYQFMLASVDGSKHAVPETVAGENFKTGINAWYSRKSTLAGGLGFWVDGWGEFSYNSTAFNDKGKDDYLLFNISPSAGVSFEAGQVTLKPYVRVAVVKDFFGSDWNRETWTNNLQYGPGLRISLDRLFPGDVFLFAEYLRVEYFNKKLDDVTEDVRVGITFWIPVL